MKSTEVLNVNDLTWSDGPDLPIGMYSNAGVESNDNQYLGFSVGGFSDAGTQEEDPNMNTIYGLQKSGENLIHCFARGPMERMSTWTLTCL